MKSPIVILHGWGLSKKKFEPLIHEFENRGHNVYAVDFPGFGDSNKPDKPMNLTDYANFLYSFLEKEQIKSPIFIGHSFSERVSLRFSTLWPKSVRALILTGAPGYTPVSRKKLFLFIAIAKLGKTALSLPILSMFSNTLRGWYYYIVGAREYYRAEGNMRETFKNIVSELLIEDMKHVVVPCLLLWGEQDGIVPLEIAKRMEKTISGSVLHVIKEADHGVPYKKPKEFADASEKFLTKI
jgi:pimeloyl-ACP methyl ester carboxylesterase